jgi:hypothetical protein
MKEQEEQGAAAKKQFNQILKPLRSAVGICHAGKKEGRKDGDSF